MIERLQAIEKIAKEKLQASVTGAELEAWRVDFLGKKGELSSALRAMGSLPAEERPKIGQVVNTIRTTLEEAFESYKTKLETQWQKAKEESEKVDITLSPRLPFLGTMHPLQRVIRRIEDIFIGFGFTVERGPHVETDHFNFEMLNLPKDHPARDMQDTFYFHEEMLMRTHTSPMQARTMQQRAPHVPLRILVPGRVYRRDDDDATHSHEFTQIEGLVVDYGISMSDLKGVLLTFAKELFGEQQEIRLRPSFFPFTEPSAEMDVRCIYCGGEGCSTCKHTGWIEILGCGMVHPSVLTMNGYTDGDVTGFAFGMGVERIAMLLYGITDIRQFYTNDVRLLQQFIAVAR
nr:phenylalanine--tRNA ligase subunit alpha [Bacilli bacterium]